MNEFTRKAIELADAWVVASIYSAMAIQSGKNTDADPGAARAAFTAHLEGGEQEPSPREHQPDDMTVPKASGDLQPGDYVFACRWGDGDPGDPWCVGWVESVDLTDPYPIVRMKDNARGWRRAMKITEEQGHRICALYPAAEELSHQERLAARAEAFGLPATPTEEASK
jgi:hypothetical protein